MAAPEDHQQKLREMEAEMSRFEQEIAAPSPAMPAVALAMPGGHPRMVIGAQTFNQVAASIATAQATMAMGVTAVRVGPMISRPITVHSVQPVSAPIGPAVIPVSRPVPAPRPIFIPHQLQRPPMVPAPPMPPLPPMGHIHMSQMGHPMVRHAMVGPVGPMMGRPIGPMGGERMQMGPMPGPMPMPRQVPMQPPPPRPQPGVVVESGPTVYKPPTTATEQSEEQPSTDLVQAVEIAPVQPTVEQPVELPQPGHQQAAPTVEQGPAVAVAEESTSGPDHQKKRKQKDKQKKYIRTAAGQLWEDSSLQEWETDDFRIFCGDLGNEVNDDVLARAFNKYPSFLKAKVIRDKRTNKTKGYGFVSFKDPNDFVKAMREMNGKYVGNRPIKLRKSTWKDRSIDIVRKKQKERNKLGYKM
ncbi:RNA-binding protein 42-like isoform X2 [Branchiostoma floridae]|uniref:RNA-binding protein 42 n=1 Tax=Branchiostoma floridae TaxID=7739 RepID=A0A9J7M9Z4_BRAFL|nr:RNA-binding protein 42-like isoform X1 [Branchiostoma floridae]XP_035697348.1 RNA-binding protein 42-like isoform X2 [Branchiostoma floridae]